MNTDRIWLNHYPPGVPAEIDAQAYASLNNLLRQSCARFSGRKAFLSMGVAISYREFDRLSRNFAAWLQARGLRRGERVAIMLPNLLQYPVVSFGALRAGLTVVNVNPLYTASELEHQLIDAGATAIVVLENFAHTVELALPRTRVRHVITTEAGDLFPPVTRWLVNFAARRIKRMVPRWSMPQAVGLREALARGAQAQFDEPDVRAGDVAFLQYTGGTTGRPKGAVLTHGNMVANVEQTAAWIRGALAEGEETVVTALPLYHVFALTANLLVFLKLGGTNLLIANPRDLGDLISQLTHVRFTAITGVNTLFEALLNNAAFARVRAANGGALKLAVAGGMAVQRGVAGRWQQVMGTVLVEGYGLTEASPIVCANPVNARTFSGKLGLPVPSTDVRIRDERGIDVAAGEIGEICVRGPQVMRGYWNAPDETAKVLSADGWLRTGDMGWMDARGFVEFADRSKDVIVVSGFKAYPTEIENVARLHPGVREAGAVAIPDARSGEAVALFVVKHDPDLTAESLLAHCRQHLTGYKVPKYVEFRDALPKNPLGKILRRELKAAAPQAGNG